MSDPGPANKSMLAGASEQSSGAAASPDDWRKKERKQSPRQLIRVRGKTQSSAITILHNYLELTSIANCKDVSMLDVAAIDVVSDSDRYINQ